MRKIIYLCDECQKVLSDDSKISLPHLSIVFADHSGWVSNQLNYTPCWRHDKKVSGIRQFCNGVCLGRYFNKLKPKKIKKTL
jgi:hypothetical protein